MFRFLNLAAAETMALKLLQFFLVRKQMVSIWDLNVYPYPFISNGIQSAKLSDLLLSSFAFEFLHRIYHLCMYCNVTTCFLFPCCAELILRCVLDAAYECVWQGVQNYFHSVFRLPDSGICPAMRGLDYK